MKTYLRHVMPITLAVLAACTGNTLEVGNVEKEAGDASYEASAPTGSEGGECTSQTAELSSCNVDQQVCFGPTVCRSCNVGLWALGSAWRWVCASFTKDGKTVLYWQSRPEQFPWCTPGPGAFTDNQCTQPAVVDGGVGDAAVDDGGQVACPFVPSPKPISLGTVLALGTSPKTGTIYLVDQVDNLQRVFVSGYSSATPEEPVILKRQRISGSGSGPDFMVFNTSGPDAIFTLQIDTPAGGAMRMGVVQGVMTDRKTITIGQDGEELRVMVNPVPKISLRSLPGDVTTEYVASTDDGNFMLVTRPTDDWKYSDFRLFFGPATAMAERSVSTVNRAKDGISTKIVFQLNGSTATASFAVVFADGGSVPGPATLTIGAQVSPLTRLSIPPADAKYVCGVSLPQCRWPAAVDPKDADADNQCRAGRVLVTCDLADGSRSVGLRDDPRGCLSQCADNEYGAACGAVGPGSGPIPAPPQGCHSGSPTPAGVIYYCCPCL